MSVEIALKPKHLHPVSKKQGSHSSQSGAVGGKKHKATNGLAALTRAELQKVSREQTVRNRKILIIYPNGKRRFILMSEYETR